MAARPETPAPGSESPNAAIGAEPTLHLAAFIPFRLNRLAVAVSEYLSEVYRRRFDLDIPEWRVIATVGPRLECTAQHIAASTRMHKTRVSRAIAHLEKRRLIERASRANDRRERLLRLTKTGRALYGELVPLALERERTLLGCLSQGQLDALTEGLKRLEEFLGVT